MKARSRPVIIGAVVAGLVVASLLVAWLIRGCVRAGVPTINANRVVVQSASADQIVLSLQVKAGTRVWLEYSGDGSGLCSIPRKDMKNTVTYRRTARGYSIEGDGLAAMHNGKAQDVSFHDVPVQREGELEIGTYSQWGTKDIKIVFRLE